MTEVVLHVAGIFVALKLVAQPGGSLHFENGGDQLGRIGRRLDRSGDKGLRVSHDDTHQPTPIARRFDFHASVLVLKSLRHGEDTTSR